MEKMERNEKKLIEPHNIISKLLEGVDGESLKEIAKEFATTSKKEFTGLGTQIPNDLEEVEMLIDNGNLEEARVKIGFLATVGHNKRNGIRVVCGYEARDVCTPRL